MSKTQETYQLGKELIPGGTQLLSKRPEMFAPEQWPPYYRSARGIEVVDLDGRTYKDFSLMGIGATVLGYSDPDVDAAVISAVRHGVMCTLNAPEEVELAQVLCELHPWASKVRYARGGGEAMSLAVRIARSHTGREKIAFSGYHGWTDWYLAANLGEEDGLDGHLMPGLDPAGVPRSLVGTAIPFHYNDIEELKKIIAKHGSELAAIVMEPQRGDEPALGYLEEVRSLANEVGAVLIYDEITTGFRMTAGGIHLLLGIEPDLAVFAKGMANGYAMAAVLGKSEVMEAAQGTFMSSTNWTERIGPTAALATIKKYREHDVATHIRAIGSRVMKGWREAADSAGLRIHTSGLPSLNHFHFEEGDHLKLATLFTQLMLDRGYLASDQFKPSFAHSIEDVDQYLAAVAEVFTILKQAMTSNEVDQLLKGPIARRGFYRLTS